MCKCVQSKVVKCIFSFYHLSEFSELIFCWIFLADFASMVVLNKDHTVRLDGARPANICIPTSFLRNVPAQLRGIPIPKNTFASKKNFKIWSNHFFILKNQRENLTNSLLATLRLSKAIFGVFITTLNSVYKVLVFSKNALTVYYRTCLDHLGRCHWNSN